jgi:hypothetical protein
MNLMYNWTHEGAYSLEVSMFAGHVQFIKDRISRHVTAVGVTLASREMGERS